jgi:hypothetical protein
MGFVMKIPPQTRLVPITLRGESSERSDGWAAPTFGAHRGVTRPFFNPSTQDFSVHQFPTLPLISGIKLDDAGTMFDSSVDLLLRPVLGANSALSGCNSTE